MRLRFYSTCASRMQHFAIIIGMFVHVTGRNRLYFAIDRSAVVRNMDFELLGRWPYFYLYPESKKEERDRDRDRDRGRDRDRQIERERQREKIERKTERKTEHASGQVCCCFIVFVPSSFCYFSLFCSCSRFFSLNESGGGSADEFATLHCFRQLSDRFQIILRSPDKFRKGAGKRRKVVEKKSLPKKEDT